MQEAKEDRGGWGKLSGADLAERLFLLLVLGWFVMRLAPSFTFQPFNALLLASEVFTVCLVLARKPGPMAASTYAWIIAIIGTCAPLFIFPSGTALVPIEFGATLMFVGLMTSLSAKIFLNRSFGIVAANRGVKRRGPYRLVRHPMYLGYITTQIGFLLLHISFWNVMIYAAGWIGQILRIMNEEEFLSRDEQYRDYAESVRYRLVPGLF